MASQSAPRSSALVVYVTCPTRPVALRLARAVVEDGLAACVNVVTGLTSVYRWQGKICQDRELLLILKTRRSAFPALARRVQSLHPYSVPEIIALPVVAGTREYLGWVAASVSTPRRTPRPPRARPPLRNR